MKTEAIQIEVPSTAHDPLAAIVSQRWNQAVMWRSQEKCGDESLATVLRNCYEQRNGILAPCDREIVEEIGVNAYVNLSDLKVSALVAWLRDLLINTPELPFTIDPTPIPELSDRARREVLTRVKRELYMNQFDGDVLTLIRTLKSQVLEGEQDYARRACDNMYKLMQDQCVEGDFRKSLYQTIDDFATYPFAVFHGPVPTMSPVLEWSGDRLVPKLRLQHQFKPISVWDFFWTPDSPDAQSGTGVFIRERMTKQQLYQCMKMKSYIQANVEKVIEEVARRGLHLSWLSENPEQYDNHAMSRVWGDGQTLEVLKHYGMFSGRELMAYGITGVDAQQYYDACVTVAGKHTIQAFINPNPNVNLRPVYATSFERTANRIPGTSICQKVRDVERAYMASLRYLLKNSSYASGPIGEVDFQRIQRYMSAEDIGTLMPDTIYPVDPDMSGGGRPAHYFHNVPSQAGQFLNIMSYFMDLADRITQIPASIHGEPVGTGANRTFRGMAMLYGNALKPIQSGLANMDEFMFKPMGTLLYNYNMRYEDDDSIKGDAKVRAQGATGLLQKEVAKQTAMDTLSVVAQIGSAAQNIMNPAILKWAVTNTLKASGVPVDEIEDANPAPVAQEPTGGQLPPPNGMEAAQ